MAVGHCYVFLPISSLFLPFVQRRETVEREVRVLREKISVLKIHISTITKVWPVNYVFCSTILSQGGSHVQDRGPGGEEERRQVCVGLS